MVRLVVTHGRSHEFSVPPTIQRPLEEALRWGLQRAGFAHFADIPVTLAFYGDYWRPDADELETVTRAESETPTPLQQ
jgi:hypothetical protein